MAEIGRMIGGRYRLMELRGEDDVSTVFRATDVELNRDVAVKVLRPEYGADPDFVAEFRLQMRAAAGLSHPNIVAVYDFGADATGAYVVTEYVDGQDLSSLLSHNGPVPPRRAASVTAVVADALAAAHEHGIVHGGLRAGTVIVTRDGQIKVTDFGIARAFAESQVPPELSVEEAWFRSPEQARGRRATDASDEYALGVLLFELLTGRGPWDGETAEEVNRARQADPTPRPSEFQTGIPDEIEAIDLKAMAVEPAGRFESAAILSESLEITIDRLDAAFATAAVAKPEPEPEPEPEPAPAVRLSLIHI